MEPLNSKENDKFNHYHHGTQTDRLRTTHRDPSEIATQESILDTTAAGCHVEVSTRASSSALPSSIFRASNVLVDNGTNRTPFYQIPSNYSPLTHTNPRHQRRQLPCLSQAATPIPLRQTLPHSSNKVEGDNNLLPIDSDTLLPIDADTLRSMATAPSYMATAPSPPRFRTKLTTAALPDVDVATDVAAIAAGTPPGSSGHYDAISTRSSRSHLFGECISLATESRHLPMMNRHSSTNGLGYSPSSVTGSDYMEEIDIERQELQSPDRHRGLEDISCIGGPLTLPRSHDRNVDDASNLTSPRYHSGPLQLFARLRKQTRKELLHWANTAKSSAQRMWYHHRPPPSPRSRQISDLSYLRECHQEKMDKLVSSGKQEEHFDFALVLTSQEVYAFWADLLDFRMEYLGEEVTQAMDNGDPEVLSAHPTFSMSLSAESPERFKLTTENNFGQQPAGKDYATPSTGIHRRRGRHFNNAESLSPDDGVSTCSNVNAMRPRLGSLTSPYILAESTPRACRPRMSLFERAIGMYTPAQPVSTDEGRAGNSESLAEPTPTTAQPNRRRWGNHGVSNGSGPPLNSMMSPPIRSLTHGGSSAMSSVKRTTTRPNAIRSSVPAPAKAAGIDDVTSPDLPNNLRMEDIPTQVIPRGIAARTNGMMEFLSALKRGIVVRRHRAGMNAIFCRITSNDGGDTISYDYVHPDEAMNAFKEQRVRYNRIAVGDSAKDIAQVWSYLDDNDEDTVFRNQNFSVPDFIAAKEFRDQMIREKGISRKFSNAVTKVTKNGSFRASEMVAVHPARHADPRSDQGELGTSSLRRSKSGFSTDLTFSVVCKAGQRLKGGQPKMESFENKWYTGEGSEVQFKYLDFEAATEGEYWLIFRGFLLLHRDAAAGRFAAHRAAGIGSHINRLELHSDFDEQNVLHRDEFHEPVTPSFIENLIVRARKMDITYMEGFTLPGAVPPPSDYFLGFRSPGTQVWSRLRQAGLETHRIHNLDTRSVMIKIRCPEDRLMDVAEVLRLKLKTRSGSHAPFREDSIHTFQLPCDDLESQPTQQFPSLFRSSHRNTIIDFIIGSRIRDSGAELGQTTDLGKMILARVPLHMPQKIDALYTAWCHYWRRENWHGRDGCSLRIEKDLHGSEKLPDISESTHNLFEEHIPNRFYRFLIGSFFQPLDSIEEYFGEKIAFYFAFVQHCATHLLILSVVGLIVFVCMLTSQNYDHPIRPYFSMFTMLWSFTVMVNWRKRSNFLAYRWGTIDYKEQETTRPQFRGKYIRDEITQEWVVTYPKWKRWLKYLISFPLTLLFTVGSLLIILMFHANRDLQLAKYLEQKQNPDVESTLELTFSLSAISEAQQTSTGSEIKAEYFLEPTFLIIMVGLPSMLGLFLPLMNFILMNISYLLNDFENYRTHSEYRTFLIIKVFSFRFVCYFGTLYYYAFVGIGSHQAIENGILRMSTSLLVYTTVANWWNLFLQIYLPLLIYKIRMHYRKRKLKEELGRVEMEEEEMQCGLVSGDKEAIKSRQIRLVNQRLLLDQAQDKIWLECMRPPHDSFPEYIQAVVQFAYVTCFSVVLPITPLICLINYLISMRLDAYKVCKVRRRPLAEKTGGIGVWEHLLHIVVVVAVLTNCWLMGFTHSQFLWIGDKTGALGQFALVVGWEHVMLLIKYVMHAACSSLPKSVRDDIKQEQHKAARQRNFSMQEKLRRGKKDPCFRLKMSGADVGMRKDADKVVSWSLSRPSDARSRLSTMSEF